MTHIEHTDDAPRRARREDTEDDLVVVGRSVLINRPRQELFAFWRDFQNLPQFMENLESIRPTGPDSAVWSIKGPIGGAFEIETQTVDVVDGETIGWRSVQGSEIKTEGQVTFRDAPAGRGTVVTASIAYHPPGGDLGRAFAKLFAKEPNIQARHELKRFKMLMEAGEIATPLHHRQ